jgi:hypothetical protein
MALELRQARVEGLGAAEQRFDRDRRDDVGRLREVLRQQARRLPGNVRGFYRTQQATRLPGNVRGFYRTQQACRLPGNVRGFYRTQQA